MISTKYLRLIQHKVSTYPQNQLEKVQALFSQSFGGRTLSLEILKWQMEKNPCLQKRATSLWSEDMLVAYNALTPYWAYLYGKKVTAAVSGTTMADENFPGCSLQLFAECAKQNMDLSIIFGFPNHNAIKLVKYLGHHYVGDVAFWTVEAKPVAISDKITEFDEFNSDYEELSKIISQKHDFIKVRQRNFLNWRFFQHPQLDYHGFEYKKRGYIIVDIYIENGIKQLQVVDIIADSDEVMTELLQYAVRLAYDQECKNVKLWLTSERYSHVLEENGFVYGEHPFPMVVWNMDLDISKSYITMMDSDIF